jgi:nitrite reductase (NADH) large subunit
VTAAALREAIAAGAGSVEALGVATKAGTGCGSCKGELTQLVAMHAKKAEPLSPAVAN